MVKELNLSKQLIPLDLQFRHAEVSVQWKEIMDRFIPAVMDQFEANRLTDTKALAVIDDVRDLKFSGSKKVFEWMHMPDFIKIIKAAGFNAILQHEGMKFESGDIITYGLLDRF